MDRDVARILLKSLLGRIERDAETNRYKLGGALSDDDFAALEAALAALGERPGGVEPSLDGSAPSVPPTVSSSAVGAPAPAAPSKPLSGLVVETEVPKSEPGAPSLAPISRDAARDVTKLAAARRAAQPLAGTTLCLDFGTARSKAFATAHPVNGGTVHFDLGLGKLGGEGDSVYAVSSSVWIEDDGLVFVGRPAVSRSLRRDAKQKRFDSLKQELLARVI